MDRTLFEVVKRHFRSMLTLMVAAVVLGHGLAHAQSFPDRPVKLVVPYPPGGGNDVLARIIAPGLSSALGQQVVVENKPGAGGTIGSAAVARAPADGYTILIINTLPHTAAAGLYAKLPYDPVKDFTSIGGIAAIPYILVVHPGVPAKNVSELLSLSRTKPDSLNYASAGVGSATHLAAELFKTVTQADIRHVPYKGGGPAITDLMGGQVQMTFENILALTSHIKAGKLRPLAVTTAKRSAIFPELPTVAEAGYPGVDVGGRFGLVAPAGTPREAIERLHAALKQVAGMPDVVQQLRQQGGEPAPLAPAEFDALIKTESGKWLKVMEQAGIKAE
jgi:tripartite-type tricarboxylate transporter receptor subunit TctC